MLIFFLIIEREKEIKSLKSRLEESKMLQAAICQQLLSLTEREQKLRSDLHILEKKEKDIRNQLFQIWKVPSLFLINDMSTAIRGDLSEENWLFFIVYLFQQTWYSIYELLVLCNKIFVFNWFSTECYNLLIIKTEAFSQFDENWNFRIFKMKYHLNESKCR